MACPPLLRRPVWLPVAVVAAILAFPFGARAACQGDLSRHYDLPDWYAIPYTPSATTTIDRIEFFHGGATGTVLIQVRTDVGGAPSSRVLSSGSYEQSATIEFQGAQIPPVMLVAGVPYWIVFTPIASSQMSVGLPGTGVLMPYDVSVNGSAWSPAPETEIWIASFQSEATSVPPAKFGMTFGLVKSLYR